MGYRDDGTALLSIDGEPRLERRYVLDRADWEPRRRDDITIDGLAACRALFGA